MLFISNQSGTNLNLGRRLSTAFYRTFLESYIYLRIILAQEDLWKKLYHKLFEFYTIQE